MDIIKTKDLKKYYINGDITVKAVDGIDLSIKENEFIAIVGKSGSGKTTFLNLLSGIEKLDTGSVIINGKNISSMSMDEKAIFRRREIGIVFQSYNLVSTLSVKDNIILPFYLDKRKPDMNFVSEIMRFLSIEEKADFMPYSLSGGEKQRVAIARAMVIKPSIILADEPTGNLDSSMSKDVMNMIKIMSEKYSQTIIMVTHDESIAQFADRIIKIKDGKIVREETFKSKI